MNNDHVVRYHEALTEVYMEAQAFAGVAHIADYYLERWWVGFAASHKVQAIESGRGGQENGNGQLVGDRGAGACGAVVDFHNPGLMVEDDAREWY